jgi:replication factor A1
MKGHKEKQQYLSGAAACRWYINENDIPKIKSFQKKVQFILLFYL